MKEEKMFNNYFSEREGIREPIENTYQINEDACMYIYNICSKYFKNMERFGEKCNDYKCKCGIDYKELTKTLRIEIPDIKIDNDGKLCNKINNVYSILDFIEFVFKNIIDIKKENIHEFFHHIDYIYTDTCKVRDDFIEDINDGFKYAGLLYKINTNGIIERVINNNVVIEDVTKKLINIKKKDLKDLIEKAIQYYRSRNEDDWKTATEKIWDAFENMKTYYSADKKESLKIIFDNIAQNEESFRQLINDEFIELTRIGNTYQIRHFETGKIEIKDLKHYDYFFNRCLSIIDLTLPYLK